ncbi:hypothetical protein QWJ06_05375 [Kocuria rhizophila]|uniref:hypothetical protein n=1 Tax=Kocuria rhizophila TaxID=72000 RepID=UPI001ABEA3DC|nr:hypothetical protein [Kocuria rhizophila]MBO4145956.1 hypothetical protein [Kocuria rhizophila]MDN3226147.1 hypothetical protein [Kocuria rhizophila]QTK32182.1 hypothetical protein J5U48_03430 [Kocuria rhizophila]
MDGDAFDWSDGLGDLAPADQSYRTSAECGVDCALDPTAIDGMGVRIAFVCPQHGVQSIIDPFQGQR